MPCIILTGHPSSGKTTVAKLLRDRALLLQQHQQQSGRLIDQVILINEESECESFPTKNDCYQTPIAEKATRATLKAAFDRVVGDSSLTPTQRKRRLIIFDSLNYIKGYRYELYCISKAAGEVHGVLWVLNKPQLVREWNSKKNSQQHQNHSCFKGSYSLEVLEELIQRYEPPDERNRWDQPLFTIDMAVVTTTTTASTASVTSTKNLSVESDILAIDSPPTSINHVESKTPSTEPHSGSPPSSSSYTNTTRMTTTITATTTTKSELLQQSVYNMHGLGEALRLDSSVGIDARTSQHDSMSHGDVQENYAGKDIGTQTTVTSTTVPKNMPSKSAFQRARPKTRKGSTLTAAGASSTVTPNDNPALYAYTPDDLWAKPSSSSSSSSSPAATRSTHANFAGARPMTPSTTPHLYVDNNSHNVPTAVEVTTDDATMDDQRQLRSLEEQLDDILYALLKNTKALKEGISTQQHVVGQAIGWKSHYTDR
jgi:tRNA uridine 5-carbamoylmethylation protein Kti12